MTWLPCKHSAFCSKQPLAQNLIKQRLCGASSHRNKLQLHLMCAYLWLLTQNTYLHTQTESNPPSEQRESSISVPRWRASMFLCHAGLYRCCSVTASVCMFIFMPLISLKLPLKWDIKDFRWYFCSSAHYISLSSDKKYQQSNIHISRAWHFESGHT